MNDFSDISNVGYLLWRNAYLPQADVKPTETRLDIAPPTPDGAVDREEWLSFFNRRDLWSEREFFDKTISHLIMTGQTVSHNLQTADTFYRDYTEYAAYVRSYLARNPGLAGGGRLGNDPEQLLQLAERHADSLALISFLGEAARFANVTSDFRGKALDFLWQQYWQNDQALKNCKGSWKKSNQLEIKAENLINALTVFSRSGLISKAQAEKLLARCLDQVITKEAQTQHLSQLIFQLLEQEYFSPRQRMETIDRLALIGYDLTYVYQLTQSPNLSQSEIIDLCRYLAKNILSLSGQERSYELYYPLFYALPYAYLNSNVNKQGAAEISKIILDLAVQLNGGAADKLDRFAKKGFNKMLSLSLAMMMTDKGKPLSDPEERRKVVGLYTKALMANPETADPEPFRDLFYNLAEFLPAGEAADLYADFLNNVMPAALAKGTLKPHQIQVYLQIAAVTINSIHDRDLEQNDNLNNLLNWRFKHRKISHSEYQREKQALKENRDAKRRMLAARLTNRAKILLIGLAGADLYTSTFLALYGSLNLSSQNIDQFIKDLESVEYNLPAVKTTTNFMLTLASFGKLTELFLCRPAYFLNHIQRALSVEDPEELTTNTYLIGKTISDFFHDPRLAIYKETVEISLLQRQKTDRTGAIAYLIKNNQAAFSPARQAAVNALCQRLPELLSTLVPAAWIKHGTLKAKLFFYQPEHYYLVQAMLRDYGFSSRTVDSETVELSLRVNGIRLVVEASINCNKENIDKSISNPDYFLIGHRGHSYQLSKTFNPYDDFRNLGKLIFIGSCGGFRAIPDLRRAYSGNYFIADETTGEGMVNNKLLYHFMSLIAQNRRAVSQGKFQFDDLEKQLIGKMPGYEKLGLIMPHNKSLLLYDFISKYQDSTLSRNASKSRP
jgi:hypothetical protein